MHHDQIPIPVPRPYQLQEGHSSQLETWDTMRASFASWEWLCDRCVPNLVHRIYQLQEGNSINFKVTSLWSVTRACDPVLLVEIGFVTDVSRIWITRCDPVLLAENDSVTNVFRIWFRRCASFASWDWICDQIPVPVPRLYQLQEGHSINFEVTRLWFVTRLLRPSFAGWDGFVTDVFRIWLTRRDPVLLAGNGFLTDLFRIWFTRLMRPKFASWDWFLWPNTGTGLTVLSTPRP